MLLENTTRFIAERYGINDENSANLLLIVIKGTYIFDNKGEVAIAEKQEPIEMADQYYGKPEESSIKHSSDFSFDKVATDIALIGHAYAPKGRAKELFVIIQVGNLEKTVKVFGDRHWKKTLGFSSISSPVPFEKIPLIYENAFGGIDISNPNPKKQEAESRNPVGIGFRARKSHLPLKGSRLPNLEDPKKLIKSPYDRPNTAGFGFISPSWQPRSSYAGTYDEKWQKNRMPLLPTDFDKQFFNAAHPDLVYNGFLQGNEPVKVAGVSPRGPIHFSLPNDQPKCVVETKESEVQQVEMKIDKLVINADVNQFIIVWSGSVRIPGEFQDIETINCE